MGIRGNGLRKKSNPKPILGYTDTETVKLDLDNMPFKWVKYWSVKTLKQFRLRGLIILKSSASSYHVVFDRPVPWSKNVGIVAWVCLVTKHRRLTEWLVMQLIKKGSTLRVSSKKDKSPPRLIYRYGEQEQQVKDFLQFRKLGKALARAEIDPSNRKQKDISDFKHTGCSLMSRVR